MKNSLRGLLIVCISVVAAGCSLFGIRGEETPDYKVIEKDGSFEIRQYSPYIIAKTTVEGEDYEQAQSTAFRRLAGYIFGKNEKNLSMKMTAPVTQKQSESEKLAMTAPVTQAKSSKGWTMTFVMPSKYSIEELPRPKDKSVEFEKIPAKQVAAIRFTWLTDQQRNQEKAKELLTWINAQAYRPVSDYKYAGYDPPWTIPFLRRQEIQIEIEKD